MNEARIISIWASLQEEEEVSDQAYLHQAQAKPSSDPNWVICNESNSSPSTRWHTYRVPLYWVNKVELLRILLRVKVPKPLANDKEVEPVKVKRMAFRTKNASILHHQLYTSVIRQNHHVCPSANHCVVRWGACVVKRHNGIPREVRRIHSVRLPRIVRLKESFRWHCEGDVADRSSKHCGVSRTLARLVVLVVARVCSQSHREEELPINLQRHVCRVSLAVQASQLVAELGSEVCVV